MKETGGKERMNIKELEPKKVFQYFEEISNVPRGSKQTNEIASYLESFAKEQGLKYRRDESDNVIIIKEASKGYEDSQTIMIQAHTDMVCEKTGDSKHDFEKEGLSLLTDGAFVSAKETTLGGDDGIGVAYGLAILSDKQLEHPRLEVIFTSNEEIGLLGAAALDMSDLKGRRLINIDSEEEGYLLVGCAGGCRFNSFIPINTQEETGLTVELEISGLKGGHSGTMIHEELGNSNILMGRLLYRLNQKLTYTLASLEGGTKDNAIPRSTKACILIDEADFSLLESLLAQYDQILKNEYAFQDPDVRVISKKGAVQSILTLDYISKEKVIFYLMNVPNGIIRMNKAMEGMVETSLNIGICKLDASGFSSSYSVRSSIDSCKDYLNEKLSYLTEFLGGSYTTDGDYPAWEYQENSPLRDVAVQVYEEQYKEKPVLQSIHAGLECGLLSAKVENLDCISLGPDILGAHTTEERLNVASTQRVWKYLVELLKRLK